MVPGVTAQGRLSSHHFAFWRKLDIGWEYPTSTTNLGYSFAEGANEASASFCGFPAFVKIRDPVGTA